MSTKLELLRTKAAMSSVDVANMLGTTPGTVSRWNHGRAYPRPCRPEPCLIVRRANGARKVEDHQPLGIVRPRIGKHLIHVSLRHPERSLVSLQLLPLRVDDDVAVDHDVRS